ncbi:MAG: sigma-70 family RNA polymerase sigma factor [Flavobacteriales bacterium]|nr:sigma-70 family RNA polymerase sigma factor [Flavobacteriales bacterium]
MTEVTFITSELLQKCQEGDTRSQLYFYELLHKPVFNTCLRVLGNKVEAEDVMQESFITAFDKLNQLDDLSKITGWLCSIARNKSLNYITRNRKTWVDLTDQHAETEDENEDEEQHFDVAYIYKGIKHLPEGYRVIMNLYLFEGMNHEQIGDSLGISPSTSRSQYTRAKRKLREIIEEHYA